MLFSLRYVSGCWLVGHSIWIREAASNLLLISIWDVFLVSDCDAWLTQSTHSGITSLLSWMAIFVILYSK